MIARVWHGIATEAKTSEHLTYIKEQMFRVYRSETPGNRGGDTIIQKTQGLYRILALVPLGIRIFSEVSDWTRCGGGRGKGIDQSFPNGEELRSSCHPSPKPSLDDTPDRIILAILDFVHFVFCTARSWALLLEKFPRPAASLSLLCGS